MPKVGVLTGDLIWQRKVLKALKAPIRDPPVYSRSSWLAVFSLSNRPDARRSAPKRPASRWHCRRANPGEAPPTTCTRSWGTTPCKSGAVHAAEPERSLSSVCAVVSGKRSTYIWDYSLRVGESRDASHWRVLDAWKLASRLLKHHICSYSTAPHGTLVLALC